MEIIKLCRSNGDYIDCFTQWDSDQWVFFYWDETVTLYADFCTVSSTDSLRVEAENVSTGFYKARVPNVLFTQHDTINVFIADEDKTLLYSHIPVREKPMPDDFILDDDRQYISLIALSAEMNDMMDTFSMAESTRNSREEVRVSNENKRKDAEDERIAAENIRKTKENERLTSEENRVSAENQRIVAEKNRASAETNRASAETGRSSAENTRVTAESERVVAENERNAAESERQKTMQDILDAETGALQSINEAGSTHLSAINSAGTTQKNAVEATGAVQVTAVQDKGATTLASIPEDYTTLNNQVEQNVKDIYTHAPGIICTASGRTIHTTDSADKPLPMLEIYGESTQVKTTGKNLLDSDSLYGGYKQDDGSYLAQSSVFHSTKRYFKDYEIGKELTLSVYVKVTNTTRARIVASINGVIVNSNETNASDRLVVTITPQSVEDYFHITYSSGGNGNIIASKIQLELGSTATTYEPYTGGAPSPSPTYPQEITSVGDGESVEMVSAGKNLFFPIAEDNINGVTLSRKEDYFVLNGTSNVSFNFSASGRIDTDGVYTLSANNPVHNNLTTAIVQVLDKSGKGATCVDDVVFSKDTKTLFSGDGALFRIRVEKGVTYNNFIIKPQLELGSTATPYEPYRSTSSTITLPSPLRGIPVSSGGNVTIDGQQYISDVLRVYSDGSGEIERNVGKELLSNLTWTIFSTTDSTKSRFSSASISNIVCKPDSNLSIASILCSKYLPCSADDTYNISVVNGVSIHATNGNIIIYDNVLSSSTNVTDFVNSLGDGYIVYLLSTPTTEQLTPSQVSGFLQTYKPVTNMWNSENAHMAVDYVADTKIYVEDTTNMYVDNKITEKVDVSEYARLIGTLDLFDDSERVLGVSIDYQNKTFSRLASAKNLSAGADFDKFSMFGGRKRCNVSDNGTIVAWYGDVNYAEDGSMGQVMVYQPKFYYLVCPVVYDPIDTGIGYHLRKANYYVSEKPRSGFRLHPAFYDAAGNELEYILDSGFEGSIWDADGGDGTGAYLQNDEQVMSVSADKFCSIAGVKPASGLTQGLTRPNIEQMAQNRGSNWHGDLIKPVSARQLLMIIEMGMMNLQTAIGQGVVSIADNSSYNCSSLTGSTSALGNSTGQATQTINEKGGTQTVETTSGKLAISWRGTENPWGNIWKFVYGINIWGNGSMGGGQPYICTDFSFAESKNSGNYEGAGFTVTNANGHISAMGYSTKCDWLFIASETLGNSSLPVGDYTYITVSLNGYRIALLGGYWHSDGTAGAFYWNLYNGVGTRTRYIGGRLVYIPTRDSAVYLASIAAWKEKMNA